MSILKNVGKLFIETEEQEGLLEEMPLKQNYVTNTQLKTSDMEVSINTNTVALIDDIYEQNNLSDKSKSIFKVEEIKKVLPDSLPNESKKASVIGMMGISGLNLENVTSDANTRIEVLNLALKKFSETTVQMIGDSQEQISELESQINSLKEKITLRKKEQENQEQIINSEVEKINNMVNFIK